MRNKPLFFFEFIRGSLPTRKLVRSEREEARKPASAPAPGGRHKEPRTIHNRESEREFRAKSFGMRVYAMSRCRKFTKSFRMNVYVMYGGVGGYPGGWRSETEGWRLEAGGMKDAPLGADARRYSPSRTTGRVAVVAQTLLAAPPSGWMCQAGPQPAVAGCATGARRHSLPARSGHQPPVTSHCPRVCPLSRGHLY